MKRKGTTALDKMMYGGQTLNKEGDVLGAFAKHFACVYSNHIETKCSPPTVSSGNTAGITKITIAEVHEAVKGLKPKKSLGSGNIPP